MLFDEIQSAPAGRLSSGSGPTEAVGTGGWTRGFAWQLKIIVRRTRHDDVVRGAILGHESVFLGKWTVAQSIRNGCKMLAEAINTVGWRLDDL